MGKNKKNKQSEDEKNGVGKANSDQNKKFNLYRRALRRTLKAGAEILDEDPVLNELRKTLNIDNKLHQTMKKEVLVEKEKMDNILKESKIKIAKVERQINELKKKSLDVKIIEDLLEHARDAKNEQSYDEFDGYIEECIRIATNLKRQDKTQRQIENVVLIITKAEKMGANVKKVRQIIKKSETALSQKHFTQAVKLATEARKASIILRRFGTADKQITSFLLTLDKAKQNFDVNDCKILVKEAKKALKNNDYETVSKSINKAKAALRVSKRYFAAESNVIKIRELVKSAKEMNVDLKNINPLVKQLEMDLKSKEYTKLSKQATAIRKAVREVIKLKNANDKISEAQEAIDDAKRVGSSVKTASRLMGQAKRALKSKKYNNVHKYARSATKIAYDGKRTTIRRKALSAISSAKFLIKDVKDFGVDVIEAEQLLDKADQAFKKNEYDKVGQYANEAEVLAKKTFDIKKTEYMEKSIEEALLNIKLMLAELEELNIETKEIQKLYTETQELLNIGDFKNAEKTVKKAEELAKKTLDKSKQKHIQETAKIGIEESRKFIEEAKDLEIDVFTVEPLLDEAEELFEDKLYEEVIEKNEEIKIKIDELKDSVLKTRTQALIDSTNALIKDAKNVGADLSEAEKIMLEVKSQFKDQNYTRAENLVKQCERVARDSWGNFRSTLSYRSMSEVQQIISDAKDYGVDVSEAQNLMKDATLKLDEKDFETADDLLEKVEANVKKDWHSKRKEQAQESLDNLKEVFDEIEASGQSAEELRELLMNAEQRINIDDLETVDDYLDRANSLTSELLPDHKMKDYMNKIDKNKEILELIRDSGIDAQELEDLILKTDELSSTQDMETIEQQVEQIESMAQDFVIQRREDLATREIEKAKEDVERAREIGGDIDKAEVYLSEAEKVLNETEFDIKEAQELLYKVEDEAQQSWTQRKTELTKDAVTSAQERIKQTKDLGADVSNAERLLNEAEDMFGVQDFQIIDTHIQRVTDIIDTTQNEQKSKMIGEAVFSTKELLEETREMGVNVDDAQSILQQAEGMFQEEDFDAVEDYIKKAESAIKTSQVEFKKDETSKLVSSTKAKIDEGRQQGANVNDAEELLKQAEEMLFTDSDVEAAEALIKQSQNSLASNWDQYQSQKLIDDISGVHGRIVKARAMGVNITEAEQLLHDAEEAYRNNNMDNVDNLLGKINEIIEKEYDEHYITKITILINDVQTLIKKAKDKKLDVSVTEDILNKAISEFENKNYPEAEKLGNKAKDIVTELLNEADREEVQKILDSVKILIADAKALNIDVSPAEKLYRQAQALFKAKEYENARDYAIKSENILNSLAERYVKNIHPHITIELATKEIIVNKWNKCIMKVTNDGKIRAQEVSIDLEGEIETKGKKLLDGLDQNEDVDLDFGLKSTKAGELVIDAKIQCFRPFDRNEYSFSDTLKLKSLDPGSFMVQDVFVIYIDGCLIIHRSREYREMVDDDIFSSMLIAVQNFILDSFRKTNDEGLRRLDFGKNKILIEIGPKFFLACVVEGEEPGMLPLYMVEAINNIQDKFGSVLDNWDGYLEKLDGIGEIIDKLLNLTIVESLKEVEPKSIQDSMVNDVESMITEAKDLGIDTTSAEDELKVAETMIDSSDYASVWTQVKKADGIIREARRDYYYQDVKSAISTAKENIAEAKEQGIDVTDVEETFQNMKELVQREEYPKVLEMAGAVTQKTKDIDEKSTLSKTFNLIEKNLEVASNWGIDLSDAVKKKDEIKVAIEEKDFESAKQLIEEMNGELKNVISNTSLDSTTVFSKTNQNLEELNKLGIDTTEFQEVLNTVKQAFDDVDLNLANELLLQLDEKLILDKNNYYASKASEIIDSSKESLAKLNNMNIEVIEAKEMLSIAEVSFGNGDFLTAYESATKTQGMLDDASHSHQSKAILDTVNTAEVMVTDAETRGIEETRIRPIEDLINDCKTALEARDYQKAGELAIEANTSAKDNLAPPEESPEELKAAIDSTMSALSSTKQIGADTSEVEDLVQRMKKVLDEGDIEKTKEYMENIQKNLERLQIPYRTQLLTSEINKLEKYLNESKENGIDVSEAEQLIDNAKTILETEEFDSVEEYLSKAKYSLDQGNETHRGIVISETIQSTYQLANEVKEMGAEVSYAFDLLKQSETMLQKSDLDSAEEFATNAFNTTQEVKKQFLSKETNEQIIKAEKEIEEAKGEGLNTIDAERLITQAKEYFKEENFENSNQYAINTQHLILDIREKKKASKASEELEYIKQLYNEVKKLGANVAPVDAPIMQTQASINNNDFDIAITYANDVKNQLNQIKQPFLIKLANTAIERAKNILVNAKNYGADITEAQNIFDEAQKALSSQDLSAAEEKAKRAEKLALDAQKKHYDNYISNEISTLKNNIEKLKTQGYDIIDAEEMLGDINSIYLEKKYKELSGKIKGLKEHLSKLEEKKYIDKANDTIAFSKAMIKYIKNNIKDIGARIKEPEKLILSAEDAFQGKEYMRAEQFALEAQKAVENLEHAKLDQFLFVFRQLQTEEMLSQTRNVIANIKKLGVDVSESEELTKKAEGAFQDEETYSDALGYLTDAKIYAHEQENKFQEKNAANALSAAESLIISIKAKGIDVGSANKLLDQAKSALEIKEFKKSILFAGKAKFTAKKLIDEVPGQTSE